MADIAGVVVSVVIEVGKCLAVPIWRQFKYLLNYKTNFDNLQKEVNNLKNARDGIQHGVTAAEGNVEEIKPNVKEWQKEVEKTITKAEQMIQEKANDPRCFKGLCPNFVIHYKQSRKAFKLKRDVIDPLLQQGEKLGPISYQTNPPDRRLRPNEDYLDFESRNSTMKNVWYALNNENVFMIGVYGMGGLGKTTLVRELGRKAMEEKLFKEIVFVEVSESPDVEKIQKTIAKKLGLTFKNENESEMADKIYLRMKDKNILLILDNIWEYLELDETVGIPCRADRGRNKLLFTTRNLDVLQRMRSTNNYEMGILNEEEAWTLFTKMAALTDNVIQTHGLHSLSNDVCKECGGLPIVICTIGRALIGKTEPFDWKVVLQELRAPSPTNFTELLKEEYRKIELSYKYLRNDELKKTFLIASLLENNTSISDLFKHVVCQDILEGANLAMENARNRLDRVVRELKYACLLLDGVESGQFAMHDVVRVIAITIANVNHHVFTARNDVDQDWKDRDKLKKCTMISLPGRSTIISQLWPNDLDCPNLEYFYMTDTWDSSFKIPEDFFKVMPKLRVLNLVRLQQSLPSSIHQLTNLQTLCLDKSDIEGVPIIGELKKLKVLSLRGSYIKEFPTEMGQLTQLRLLDLSDCYRLKVIAPNVISKLSNLEELYLNRCPIQWKLEELKDLKLLLNLTNIELDIKGHRVLPEDFFSRELIRYKISVGKWGSKYGTIGEQECLRILKLIFNPTIHLEELCGIKNVELLWLAEYLDDEDEDDEDEDEDDREHSKFHLQSNEITPLFNENVIFPDLKVLALKNIISRKIWDNQLPSSSFQNLKELILWRCAKIKFVFPYTITKNLRQLQDLMIEDCIDLEEIVATEEITEAAASFVFSQATFIQLANLPKLATFCRGIHTSEWPKLKQLGVRDCDKFKLFNSEPNSSCLDQKINHDLEEFELKTQSIEISWNRNNKALDISSDQSEYIPLPVLQRFQSLEELKLYDCEYKEIKSVFDLPNLNVLHVQECSKLVSLVPSSPSTARSLVQLKELSITHCGMLAEILENKRDVTTIEIVFQKLTKLSLDQLESLTCFCSGNHSLNFPSLEKLIITECLDMNTFLSEISNVSEFTLQSNEITPFFNQKVIFSKLKVLELKNISPEKIWDSQLSTSSYQNLTHLTLFGCDKIKYVFPLSIAKSLQQLQCLELTSCKVLEKIVAPEEGTEATINFFFPQVTKVKLCNLPEFTDLYPGIHMSEWPKLKELDVKGCGKFKMLTSEPNFLCFEQKINHDLEIFDVDNGQEMISWFGPFKSLLIISFESAHILLWLLQRFENLTNLSVCNCKELVNLTTLSTARSLVQLRELKISNCKMLVEILEIEEDATTEIVFENLNKLSFDSMENLTCFCSGNYTFNFHSLEELNITKCPNIKTFCRGILITPKLQKISYEEMEVEIEGNDLNKTIQGLYKKKNQNISLDLNFKFKTFHHDNSTEISYNRHPSSFYQNLTHLFLWKCGNIKYAFPSSIAKSLHQLQQLKIQNCKALEEIVAKEDGANAVVNFVFPNITLLKFKDLPELTAFYPGLYALEMPKLKGLVVKDCTKYASLEENNVETELNILAPKSIFLDNKINHDLEEFQLRNGLDFISWRSQSKKLKISYKTVHIPLWLLQRFENLACLSVSSCKLVNLTTLLIAKSLVQLRKLKISNCKMLVEILEIEDDATIEIVFENLSKLSFAGIESLLCFSSGNYTFNFPSLEELNITNCPNMMTFCRGILSTPKLQKINYEKMEVENEGNDLNKTIQGLYKKKDQDISLDLNLKCKTFHHDNSLEIGYNRHPTSFYQNLTHLFLWKCENIKYAFPSSIAKSLHQLQQLKIQNCKVLKEIVAKEEGANAVVDFIFPNITLLKVEDLPELTAFYPGIYTLEMPKLKELVVKDCTKYASLKENNMETELNILAPKSIFLDNKINFNLKVFDGETNIGWLSQSKALTIKDISVTISLRLLQRFENVRELQLSSSQYKDIKSLCDLPNLEILEVRYCYRLMSLVPFSGSFQNLKVLKVGSCDRLIMKLITLSVAKSLTQLRELSISYCDMLTEIVDNEGDATSTEIVFNSLNKLSLDSLESLICFCSGNYSFNFPSLEELIIKDCPNLEIFCQGRLCTPNLDRFIYKFKDRVVKLDEAKKVREVEIWDNDLNTTIQQKYKKKVGSSWEELTLSGRNIMTTLQGEFQENFDKVKTLRLIKDDHEYIGIHILEKFINLKKLILIVSLYEEIFSCEEGEEHVGALSKLEELQLQGLFNLKCSWKQDFRFKSILQNLHSLNVKHCHNLMTLLPSSSSFKNLMTLEVEYCSGMQNLMTSSTAKSLVCLKTLSIEGCEMMIEVLASEGDIEKNEVVFERLEELHLYNLESLTWFYYGNYTLKFPFLESLTVAKCSKMKTFSREGVNMPRLQQVNGNNCSDDLNYVTTQLQNNCSKVWEKFPR